jgi:hypothetical protein
MANGNPYSVSPRDAEVLAPANGPPAGSGAGTRG